jgi:DtxR family manganese transport transcriptional regulator
MPTQSGSSPATPAAARFARTRRAHADETGEDYVEAIDELSRAAGGTGARVKDLAQMMGVSHVTVVRIVSRLQALGLVTTSRGKPILLTREGAELAASSEARHTAVLEFLLAIGVSPAQAAIDAEGIEHHVSQPTIRAMKRVMKKLKG